MKSDQETVDIIGDGFEKELAALLMILCLIWQLDQFTCTC
jgi:hypothetical protein